MKENSLSTTIIQIGNSQGVRLPKAVLTLAGIENNESVVISVEDGRIIIAPSVTVRSGWEEAFKLMHQNQDDILMDGDSESVSDWDTQEWEW